MLVKGDLDREPMMYYSLFSPAQILWYMVCGLLCHFEPTDVRKNITVKMLNRGRLWNLVESRRLQISLNFILYVNRVKNKWKHMNKSYVIPLEAETIVLIEREKIVTTCLIHIP